MKMESKIAIKNSMKNSIRCSMIWQTSELSQTKLIINYNLSNQSKINCKLMKATKLLKTKSNRSIFSKNIRILLH